MICPSCGDEFRDGFDRCPDCDVDLVASVEERSQPAPHHPQSALLLVSADVPFVIIAKSLLEGASIPYSVQGEESQALFGSPKALEIRIFVPVDRLEDARALLDAQHEIESGPSGTV